MQTSTLNEARRQIEICNACRYCEGYCAVFPAITRKRNLDEGDIIQLANLCHNCRGCFYACQYTDPHEFALNLPQALSKVRQESWETFAYPKFLAHLFHKSGVALATTLLLFFSLAFVAMNWIGNDTGGSGFYALLSHSVLVAIFLPAFALPLVSMMIGVKRYWHAIGGGDLVLADIRTALHDITSMRNLSGGHGEGCNFEEEDAFSNRRRLSHQLIVAGFLMCFASTSIATILHYVLEMPAPYDLFSLPKLFGLPGGALMTFGAVWMAMLKHKASRNLSDPSVWGGEMGFIVLLALVGASGLLLYGLRDTTALPYLLALHLSSVMTLFVLLPYSKMAHGFYRLAALLADARLKRIGVQITLAKQALNKS